MQRLRQLQPFCSDWQQWDKDCKFAEFQKKLQDKDRRLATVFCQGFEDCNCLASAVKVRVPQLSTSSPERRRLAASTVPAAAPVRAGVTAGPSPRRCGDALERGSRRVFPPQLVQMFSSRLERPWIQAEVSPCYLALLGMFMAELEMVKALYDAQTAPPQPGPGSAAVSRNMPPVAGQLEWVLELQRRPKDALVSVSSRFLEEMGGIEVSGILGRCTPWLCPALCPGGAGDTGLLWGATHPSAALLGAACLGMGVWRDLGAASWGWGLG